MTATSTGRRAMLVLCIAFNGAWGLAAQDTDIAVVVNGEPPNDVPPGLVHAGTGRHRPSAADTRALRGGVEGVRRVSQGSCVHRVARRGTAAGVRARHSRPGAR